jgi:hypothetical protein
MKNLGQIIGIVSSFLLGGSAFLPWFGNTKIWSAHGETVFYLAIASIILFFIRKITPYPPFVLGCIALYLSFKSILDTATVNTVSIGMYLSLIAAVGIAVGAIIQILKDRKNTTT